MRYAFSIASLILGAVLLVLGVLARTVFAGPAVISLPLTGVQDAKFALLPVAQLARVPGDPRIDVTAAEAFVGQARMGDVAAWLQVTDYAGVKLNADDNEWIVKPIRAKSEAVAAEKQALEKSTTAAGGALAGPSDVSLVNGKLVLDPVGSDLWQTSDVISKGAVGDSAHTINVPVLADDSNAILLASNGKDNLPKDITVSWVQHRHTPWAGPLLVAGGVFAVVGIVLYLLALDKHHAGRGPRRGRRGPFIGLRNIFGGARRHRKRVAAAQGEDAGIQARVANNLRGRALRVFAMLGIGAVALSGCSASYWPDFSVVKQKDGEKEQSQKALAPVPVTDEQIAHIVSDIASVTEQADEKLDSSILPKRFTADALAQRTANYKVRAAVSDYGIVPPVITADALDYRLVQSTENWPRTMLLTVASRSSSTQAAEGSDSADSDAKKSDTAADDASPSLALLLTQASPHEQFLVNRVIALRGGITMPIAAPAEEGTALLSNDTETLQLSPAQVGKQFAKLLQEGKESKLVNTFDLSGSSILDHYGAAYVAQAKEKAQANGSECSTLGFSVNVAPAETTPIALSTGAGGAIVATTVHEERIVDGGGGRCLPQASATVTALSGLQGEQKRLVHDVAHQLLFFVPAVGDTASTQKVQLLGVSSELIGVRN